MRKKRAVWIRKLFINMDAALILSLGQVFGKENKNVTPRTLYQRAKRMWNNHHPAIKTWGKSGNLERAKKDKGVINNG